MVVRITNVVKMTLSVADISAELIISTPPINCMNKAINYKHMLSSNNIKLTF